MSENQGPVGEQPRDNIGLLLSLASARGVLAANAGLRPMDLNHRTYSVLDVLELRGGISQRELADELRLDPSQIVALVDSLEGRGLVERRPNPQDRRQRTVVLTTAGRTLYRRARQQVDGSLDEVLGGLHAAERDTLRELLQRIVRPTAGATTPAG
ncbi:MarR family transcriptional regulator [Georgenia daeguensis]|uniref:MarR family transcriptional regulator n=1 Tax=Georgenia daeguensis TaxID=908355 RepID=A0ABP8EX88_9MICO